MADINKVVLVGRLTKDSEIAKTNGGTDLCKFSIACNEYTGKDKDETVNYFDIVIWGKRAEVFNKYTSKGSQVLISGRLRQERFTSKDGKNVSRVHVVCDDFQFLGGKGNSQPKEESVNLNETYSDDVDFGNNVSESDNIPF